MSTTTAVAQGVSIKVNYYGFTRRFKLNLRDININTFEDKVREFLQIPAGYPCKIERYSDSASSYVVLDRSNVSVYKQLHRAAKAKAKLKIRVTNFDPPSEKQTPPPAAVESEEEPQAEAANKGSNDNASERIESPTEPLQQSVPQSVTLRFQSSTEIDASRVAQSLAAAPEVPKKEPLDSPLKSSPLSGSSSDLDATSPKGTSTSSADKPASPAQDPLSPARVCPYASLGFGDFRVCCNSCERTIPDIHYHCTKCDDDDFDLCLSCVERGITCHGPDHWLIKRFKRDGAFVTSTTETLPPKANPKAKVVSKNPEKEFPEIAREIEELKKKLAFEVMNGLKIPVPSYKPRGMVRACNGCVQERAEHLFLHCTTCENFDLCTSCFAKDSHSHHPNHVFVPAVEGAHIDDHISAKLGAGRNRTHNAICDNCDNFIRGVRHKCLDCPDWDYCSDCAGKAIKEHPGHRFAPIYEPLAEPSRFRKSTIHEGICCDGPLCAANALVTYITGVRYKCAICPDTDFCSACEAHPSNRHNRTHPLIKFKTAVRQAVVSTSGLDGDGVDMPLMGDAPAKAKSKEPTISSPRAVVNVEPSEPVKKETEQVAGTQMKEEQTEDAPAAVAEKKTVSILDLGAVYVRDTVMDGTVLQPNHVFEQTWVLRNSGDVAWPAGCAVKFVGGDYMGHVDSNHPAGISELVSASESTVCYDALEPGQEYPFTVLLRTPPREGKIISYWRLTTAEGLRFGHRLWCEVNVMAPKTTADVATDTSEGSMKKADSVDSSQMVFPKLEKESPVSSIHQDHAKEEGVLSPAHEAEFDELDEAETWDGSDDGFFTDEEYDILDASDEEYLEEQKLISQK